jgi:preprotein translocase subunit SecE
VAKSRTRTAATTTTKDTNPVIRYFQETRAELRKVTWPTRDEARNLTMIIVAVTVAMAIFLGLFDSIFQQVTGGVIAGDLTWIGVAIVLFLGGAAAFYFNGQQE